MTLAKNTLRLVDERRKYFLILRTNDFRVMPPLCLYFTRTARMCETKSVKLISMTIDKTLDTLTTGIYWRQNLWNGAATVPAILKLENGVLSAHSAKVQIFSADIELTSVRFTAFGTMLISVDGKQYDFTAVGSGVSPAFTAEMIQEVEAKTVESNTTINRIGTVLYAAGGVTGVGAGQVAGAATMGAAYFSGLSAFKVWRDVFTAAGVISKKSVKNFKKPAAIIFIAIVVVVIALVGILTAVL